MEIYPACLPLQEARSVDAYHSGWSRAIPYHIFRKWAVGYTEIYDEFFKQVHYKMEVLEECKDSNLLEDTFLTPQFRTNTYYPPGQEGSLASSEVQADKMSVPCVWSVCLSGTNLSIPSYLV